MTSPLSKRYGIKAKGCYEATWQEVSGRMYGWHKDSNGERSSRMMAPWVALANRKVICILQVVTVVVVVLDFHSILAASSK